MRAYCHSDGGAADAVVKERPNDPLALYFRFLTKRHASGLNYAGEDQVCREEIVTAGRDLLKQVPDCFRVHDGIADVGGVANLHPATTIPLELFDKAVRARLAAVPDLPKNVAQAAKEEGDEVELRKRLVAAAVDDPAEFSWGVLGRQLREIRLLQVSRRMYFLICPLGVPADDFVADALPLVADHPYRRYLECFTEPIDRAGFLARFSTLDFNDVVPTTQQLLFPLRGVDPKLYKDLYGLASLHRGLGTVPCQEENLCLVAEKDKPGSAHNVLRYNEESTLGRGGMIATNWENARPNVDAWEKAHGGDTFVLAQLGFHWLQAGALEKAEGCFERALAKSHDGWIFAGLAESYRRRGEVDRWMKAVDEFLKSEDLSLDHAHALEALAKYLMEKKEYRKARPYAELAAQSGAGWAMQSASRCAEDMEDWKAAERWIAMTSARYQRSWLDWYAWCKRTGHGDVKAAAALVEAQLEVRAPAATGIESTCIGIFLLLEKQPKAARAQFERLIQTDNTTLNGALLALACDAAGDAAARDATLKAIGNDPKPTSPKTAKILGMLGAWLASGEKSPLDRKSIDEPIEGMPPQLRANSYSMVAIFLDRHGKPEDALDYLKRANVDECYLWVRFLIQDALQQRGIETRPAAAVALRR